MSAMLIKSRSCILQMFTVGIVCILALIVGPPCSLALDGRRLPEERSDLDQETGSDGGRFRLLHSSHPQSPSYVPGLSRTERFNHAAQRSRERAAVLASMTSGARAASNTSTFVSPLDNLPEEYGMEITIGTPPRTFVGIADTGSDLVWVQCLPCSNCTQQPDAFFDPTKSSTYKKISCSNPLCSPIEISCNSTCQYEYEYGDQSSTIGDLSYETITLNTTTGNTTTATNFAFGCGHTTSGDFSNADGLIGLGTGPLSFTSQLGSLYGNKFSYCLLNVDDSASKTSPMLFGKLAVPTVATQYTPILQNATLTTFYYMDLTGIKVDRKLLNISSGAFDIGSDGSGGVIIDSGTTITTLTEAAYSPLLSTIQSLVEYPIAPGSFDLCFNLSGVPNPTLPMITLVFNGVEKNQTIDLDLPQENSFLVVDDVNTTCLAYANTTAGSISIFGNVQQQNLQILFDREASQLGFAKVDCDTLTSG